MPERGPFFPAMITRPVRAVIDFVWVRLTAAFVEGSVTESVVQYCGNATECVGESEVSTEDSAMSLNIDSGNRNEGSTDFHGEILHCLKRTVPMETKSFGEERGGTVNRVGRGQGMRRSNAAAGRRLAPSLRHTRVHKKRHHCRPALGSCCTGMPGVAPFCTPPRGVGVPEVKISDMGRRVSICIPMWYCDSRLHKDFYNRLNPCVDFAEDGSVCHLSTDWRDSRSIPLNPCARTVTQWPCPENKLTDPLQAVIKWVARREPGLRWGRL